MNVYTYHEDLREMPDQTELLHLWESSWQNRGWTPIILTEDHAKLHPHFSAFVKVVEKYPTVNPKTYELACFKRWLAMVQVGGGWMVDYDVINYAFRPQPPGDGLTLYAGSCCPCVTSGTTEDYASAIQTFATYEGKYEVYPGAPHISDQDILRNLPNLYRVRSNCINFSAEGWEQSELVHYPNGLMEKHQPRAKHIMTLRRPE